MPSYHYIAQYVEAVKKLHDRLLSDADRQKHDARREKAWRRMTPTQRQLASSELAEWRKESGVDPS